MSVSPLAKDEPEPETHEKAELMTSSSKVASDGPPHPWDSADRRRRPGDPRTLLYYVAVVPLVLLRVVLLLLAGLLLVLMCALVNSCSCSLPTKERLFRPLARFFLFALGVWPGMLKVSGRIARPAPPVLVAAPHVGMLEAFFILYCTVPRPIALEPYTKVPVASALFRATNGIAVPLPAAAAEPRKAPAAIAPAHEGDVEADGGGGGKRGSSTAGVRAAIAVHKRTFTAGDAPIMLMPEGTTSNGHALLKFFTGAFEGGCAVQPVVLRFPYTHVNAACFPMAGLASHVLRLLAAPAVRIHATFLPVVEPTAAEAADAQLYADNVRRTMAAAAGLPLSEYGARELRLEEKSYSA